MSLPILFKPKKNYKLIRVGKDNDGGYLLGLNSILSSNYLISFGICDDWSFEIKCLKLKNNLKINCYDNQLSYFFLIKNIFISFIRLFYLNSNFFQFFNYIKKIIIFSSIKKKINFKKKFINRYEFRKIAKSKKKIFFKIDIEGNEYRILNELLHIKKNIVGLIIEFHDIDLHQKKILDFIKKINLTLTHIHPNNNSYLDKTSNPRCVELTFEKSPIILDKKKVKLPKDNDMPCNPLLKDYKLKFK